jgi:hypothetical protein
MGDDEPEIDVEPSEDGEDTPRAKPASKKVAAIVPALTDEERRGFARCLRARLSRLDADIVQAEAAAKRDTFYAHWPDHIRKIKGEAEKHLAEFEGPAAAESK